MSHSRKLLLPCIPESLASLLYVPLKELWAAQSCASGPSVGMSSAKEEKPGNLCLLEPPFYLDEMKLLLMIEILHDLKDPKLWALWNIPYYG